MKQNTSVFTYIVILFICIKKYFLEKRNVRAEIFCIFFSHLACYSSFNACWMIVWKAAYWIWSAAWINDFNSYRYVEISHVGIVCIWRTWWAIIWSSHTNTYLYIFVQVHLENSFQKFWLQYICTISLKELVE